MLTGIFSSFKTACYILLGGVGGSIIFHGVVYVASGAGRGEVLMWALVSIPILALIFQGVATLMYLSIQIWRRAHAEKTSL
jgi:hypothetical protein